MAARGVYFHLRMLLGGCMVGLRRPRGGRLRWSSEAQQLHPFHFRAVGFTLKRHRLDQPDAWRVPILVGQVQFAANSRVGAALIERLGFYSDAAGKMTGGNNHVLALEIRMVALVDIECTRHMAERIDLAAP